VRAGRTDHVVYGCLLVAIASGLACGPTRPSGAIALGAWAGDHVSLTVGEAGAIVEFDCAHGTLDGQLRLDQNGAFNVAGTFVREGGPVRLDPPPLIIPARYAGVVEGGSMTLTVTTTDQPQLIGPYSLKLGGTPRLMKCL
jgi:hypothetical protein